MPYLLINLINLNLYSNSIYYNLQIICKIIIADYIYDCLVSKNVKQGLNIIDKNIKKKF